MTHALLLGLEIEAVVVVGWHLDRHALEDLQAKGFELINLVGIVREQAHALDAEGAQDLRTDIIFACVGGKTEGDVREEDIDLAWVPGAFEIPLIAKKMAESGKYDAVICLGAVIRGATSHYDLVCNEAAKGIAHVSLDSGVPVLFGVVTTENIEQAIERAGSKAGNKGYDSAMAAIEMVNLVRSIEA